MRKFLISAALLSVAATATPAMAQRYHDGRYEQLAERIDRSYERGLLSPRVAARLQDHLRETMRNERQWAYDGLDRRERSLINARLASLRRQISSAVSTRRDSWRDARRDDRYDRRRGY